MVGTETSGNRASQPINHLSLMLTVQLLDFIQSLPNPKGIPTEFLVCRDFLLAHKEEFIQKFGQQIYDAHLERYSRNRTEMHREKQKKRQEVEARRSERLALKRRDLDLRAKELELREQNSLMRENKQTDKELQLLYEEQETLKEQIYEQNRLITNARKHGNLKNEDEIRLETLKKKLEEVDAKIKDFESSRGQENV